MALPVSALDFNGNHDFRGNPYALGGASETEVHSAGVDGTSGAATLSIPIAVPPGPAGLAPTLSLNYSSDRGDGPFGVGWDLQLGEVRCTARFGVPDDYASCPGFVLGGQILVGPDGQGRYHTKVESFQRILLLGTGADAYWEVTAPGGTRQLYGESADSKIDSDGGIPSPGGAPTARWLLSKIIDIHDNEIVITYDRSDVGVAYPSTISYALDKREVVFLYQERPDKSLSFAGGIPRHLTQRLQEIRVDSAGGIFSRRLINYSPAAANKPHRSRIDSTQLFGRDCDAENPVGNCPSLPTQGFDYTETTDAPGDPYWTIAPSGDWEEEEARLFVESGALDGMSYDLGKRLADVNGDGLPDLVVGRCSYGLFPCDGTDEGPAVYINNGSDWVLDDPWTDAIDSLTYEAPTFTVHSAEYIDGASTRRRICDGEPGPPITRKISFSEGRNEPDLIAFDGESETFTPWPSWHLVDINGDGFADLVTSSSAGGAPREFDCDGNQLDKVVEDLYDYIEGAVSQEIFLNNGTGWDLAPDGMAESLPILQVQTILKHWKDEESFLEGYNEDCDESGWLGTTLGRNSDGTGSNYCSTWMEFRPQFIDLNGDGLLDLIALKPDPGALWLDDFLNDLETWSMNLPMVPSRSFAWIQDADGSGWTPAPNFDLAFPHIKYDWKPWPRFPSSGIFGGMHTYDTGVYFVDLNQDGLTDVVHDAWDSDRPSGVLLNTGTGWCSDSGDAAPPCDGDTDPNHSRYAPPIPFNQYVLDPGSDPKSKSEQFVFVDVNGDGWVDLLQGKNEPAGTNDVMKAWLHDPSANGEDAAGMPSVWLPQVDKFIPPTPFYAGTQFADLDGNGLADILHGWRLFAGTENFSAEDAYLAKFPEVNEPLPDTHSDLIDSIDNGRGGTTTFAYTNAVAQWDQGLEDDAEEHAGEIGDSDGSSATVTRFVSKPVVGEITISGVGIAADVTTRYRYGRPRFDPIRVVGGKFTGNEKRGFGLVETTKPDGSRVDAYNYQREGLVGKLSLQETINEVGSLIHHSEQTWVLASNPGSIPGAMEGVDIAQLEEQESYNVYPLDGFGPSKKYEYSYDGSYGYNFVSQVISTRATGSLTTILIPESANATDWLVGLVAEKKKQNQQGITYSSEVYRYTLKGQLESRSRDIGLRDGSGAADTATTSWTYDSYGNVKTQTESRGKDAAGTLLPPRMVEFCYDGDGSGPSWCPSIPGNVGETHSLRVGVKDAIEGVVELEYDWVMGTVLHIERINEAGDFRDSMTVERDAFGRIEKEWFRGVSFGGGDPDVQLTETDYFDAPVGSTPAYVEQFQFTGKVGEDPIRSARYLDGFGNPFLEVSKTPSGYRGAAVFRDPSNGIVRSVGPIDCDSDASCSIITDTTIPASEREVDATGRVIRVTSPDGEVTQYYDRMQRPQPTGSGTGDLFDTVTVADPNGNVTRRLMDGNRVVWVDECQGPSCSSFDSTFYTYEAMGEISTIYDALAGATGDYTSSARFLRYHYDTLGRAIQTDEPNTGSSSAGYDHQGNVTKTTSVRQKETSTYYDPLGRVTSIDRPEGVGEWDLEFTYDPISRRRESVTTDESDYSDNWEYDDFGRVKRQIRTFNDTMVMDFKYDLLGRPTRIYYPSDDSSASYEYYGAYLEKVCRDDAGCVGISSEYRLITNVGYDGLGRREDVVTTSGTVHREYYDTDDDPSGRSVNGLKRLAITAGTAAGALDFIYQYDLVGNITGIGDQSTTYDATATYTYDSRNRLKSWSDANNDTLFYTYDALGNLEGHGVASEGGTNQAFVPTTKPHQITANRIGEGYVYDADGNVIQRGPSAHFVYDSANRLVCTGTGVGECNGPAYRYDADGQLLWDGAAGQQLMGDLFRWKSSGRNAYSNIVAFGEVIAEVRQVSIPLRAVWAPVGWPLPIAKGPLLRLLGGATVLAWIALLAWLGVWRAFSEAPATATLILALTTLLVVPPPAWGCRKGKNCGGGPRGGTETTVRAFFRDHLGSVSYVTGPNVRQVYEPFGKEILATPGAKDEFTSKRYHNATDMYYYGARWYDAEAGRLAGVDPLLARPLNPQEINAYSYVLNDPVNMVDPTGMAGGKPTPGIEEIEIRGTSGSSYTSIAPGSLTMGVSRPRFSIAGVGGGLYIAVDGSLTGAQNSQEQEERRECCGDVQNEGGDSYQSEDTSYDLAAAGPDAIDQLRRLADSINLIAAMKEAEREVERLWVDGKKNGKEKYADDDAWAWKGMYFQREPNNPFLEAFDHWSVVVVRTPAGTPRDSVPEPRPLSIGSGGVKWIRPPTKIYCANCPSGVGF